MTLGSRWGWLAYPVIVVVFVLISANYIMTNKDKWTQIVLGDQERIEIEGQIAQLRERIAVLEKVNVGRETEDLKLMARAVLPNRAVWLTAIEMKDAASQSGVLVTRYQAAGVGEVKEGDPEEASASAEAAQAFLPMNLSANLRAADLRAIGLLISHLENRLPLVKISKVSYQSGVVSMTVEGAWEPWVGGVSVAGSLDQYRNQVEDIKKRLAEFNAYPVVGSENSEQVDISINPF